MRGKEGEGLDGNFGSPGPPILRSPKIFIDRRVKPFKQSHSNSMKKIKHVKNYDVQL